MSRYRESTMIHMANAETALPARLIGRIAAEMAIDCMIATRRAHFDVFSGGATYYRVVLYLALMRHAACPLAGARTEPRAMSIAGLAASLNQPFETLRRHVRRLELAGLAVRTSDGVAIPQSECESSAMLALAHRIHDVMVAMIDDLARFGVPMPPSRPVETRPAETLHAALDMVLYLAERIRPVYGTSLAAMVLNAIVAANVRAITYDPVLAMQYGAIDTIPPDHLRRPITVAAVARVLALPHSTVAREVKRLKAAGRARTVADGVIVDRTALAINTLTDNNRAATVRALQLVQRLRNGGFDFGHPAQHYFGGQRPTMTVYE
jgi:hypothetical protein